MGAQSFLLRNKETLACEFEEKLASQTNRLYIKDKFLVDCKLDLKEMQFNYLMTTFLKGHSCELSEYVHDKLAFKHECKKRESVCETEKHCKDDCSHAEISNIVNPKW